MILKYLPFHIQQNMTPESLRVILNLCRDGKGTADQVAHALGIQVGTVQHILPFIRQLGLLKPRDLLLTDTGVRLEPLSERNPSLLAEAVHHILYTTHVFDAAKRFSWAYAVVADILWTGEVQVLDEKAKSQIVGRVAQRAEEVFRVPADRVAFSRHSVRGAVNWLRALDPPVITGTRRTDSFRRRFFCSPITTLWAVDFLYRVENKSHGVRMFLPPERIERLCRLCLLDPSGVENILMLAKRATDYDHGGLFDYGTEGGFGRWILLTQPCPVPTSLGE